MFRGSLRPFILTSISTHARDDAGNSSSTGFPGCFTHTTPQGRSTGTVLTCAITDIQEAQAYAKGITRLRHCHSTAPPPAQRDRHDMNPRSTSPITKSRDTNAQNDLFTPKPKAGTPRFFCHPWRGQLLVAYVHVFVPFTLP